MQRVLTTICTAIVGLLVLTATVRADNVIYDNGEPDLDLNFASDFRFPQQIIDDFVLQPGLTTVTGVSWWGGYNFNGLPPDDFVIRIFDDDNGAPAVNPTLEFEVGDVGRLNTGLFDSRGLLLFAYSAAIPATTLNAGQTYWLSVVNDAHSVNYWNWSTTSPVNGSNLWFRSVDGDDWINSAFQKDHAFNLTGVPEPSVSLLGIAGLSLVGYRRKR